MDNEHKITADIGMRLVVIVPSYTVVGQVMDEVDQAFRRALAEHELTGGQFDFTHFNTHPCKAQRMSRVAARLEEQLYDPQDQAAQEPF